MTTINQASPLKSSGPNLTQAEVAMQMIAQRANGTLTVSEGSSGSTVNNKSMTAFISASKITKDTVTLSPSASAAISKQQVALSVIQDSLNRSNGGATYKNVQKSTTVAPMQIVTQNTSLGTQQADTSSSPLGESIIGSEDPASVISAYQAESATERFYNSSQDPTTIADQFFTGPDQQASYIEAYKSGGLTIQNASSFMSSDFNASTKFTSNGMSSDGEGSGRMDLSSIKADNVMTFDDPIAGSIVISWNNKK